jgi:hypothetical protein
MPVMTKADYDVAKVVDVDRLEYVWLLVNHHLQKAIQRLTKPAVPGCFAIFVKGEFSREERELICEQLKEAGWSNPQAEQLNPYELRIDFEVEKNIMTFFDKQKPGS